MLPSSMLLLYFTTTAHIYGNKGILNSYALLYFNTSSGMIGETPKLPQTYLQP